MATRVLLQTFLLFTVFAVIISANEVLGSDRFAFSQNEKLVQAPRPVSVPAPNPVGVTPKQWICRLIVHSTKPDGRRVQWSGSAFKVKISPNIGRTVLFTAAHVIRKDVGEYVDSVDVQCPWEDQIRVIRNSDQDMWMPNEFLNAEYWDHDYAYLMYPGHSNTGFGWQGFLNAASMINMRKNLITCGYLSQQDKTSCSYHHHLHVNHHTPVQNLYCSRGDLDRIDENIIYAKAEITSSQGGGPLYDASGTNYVVYGIVSLPSPGCLTSQIFNRLTAEKLYNIFSHLGGFRMAYRIRSLESPSVYLHMDGAGLDAANRIGGDVYAGYLNNNDDSRFMIFPVQQTSSNQYNSQLVVIRSANQNNVYLRMDGSGLVSPQLCGGGKVNCRFGIDDGEKEVFHREVEPDGQVAFRSMTYNDVHLRIDHWSVSGPTDRGTVNAQYGKFTQEVHHLESLDLLV